jgi:hypothetical protein
LEKEIKRVTDMFRDEGSYILYYPYGTASLQHIEELQFAYDLIYKYIRK